MDRGHFLPTAGALAVVLAVAFAISWHLTLGFSAFTAEDARRLRVSRAPIALQRVDLVDARGADRVLWSDDPRARTWLVTFMYTRCTSICTALGTELQQLQAAMTDGEGIRLASISFDPKDSPGDLASYAARHRANPDLWMVVKPRSREGLARLLNQAGVVAIDDGMGGFAHNAAIQVVTSSGELAALFDMDQYREALDYARGLGR